MKYRFAPTHPSPAAAEDVYAGYVGLLAHAERLGIDTARVAVGGASAGGNLAAALTLLAHDRGGIQPAFQLLVYPMLDDRTVARTDLDTRNVRVWTPKSNRYGWTSYLGVAPGSEDVSAYAAPARREDVSGLPPAWVGVGTLDLFYEEDLEYARRLTDAGVPCQVYVVPGAFHGFDAVFRKAGVSREFWVQQADGAQARAALLITKRAQRRMPGPDTPAGTLPTGVSDRNVRRCARGAAASVAAVPGHLAMGYGMLPSIRHGESRSRESRDQRRAGEQPDEGAPGPLAGGLVAGATRRSPRFAAQHGGGGEGDDEQQGGCRGQRDPGEGAEQPRDDRDGDGQQRAAEHEAGTGHPSAAEREDAPRELRRADGAQQHRPDGRGAGRDREVDQARPPGAEGGPLAREHGSGHRRARRDASCRRRCRWQAARARWRGAGSGRPC